MRPGTCTNSSSCHASDIQGLHSRLIQSLTFSLLGLGQATQQPQQPVGQAEPCLFQKECQTKLWRSDASVQAYEVMPNMAPNCELSISSVRHLARHRVKQHQQHHAVHALMVLILKASLAALAAMRLSLRPSESAPAAMITRLAFAHLLS